MRLRTALAIPAARGRVERTSSTPSLTTTYEGVSKKSISYAAKRKASKTFGSSFAPCRTWPRTHSSKKPAAPIVPSTSRVAKARSRESRPSIAGMPLSVSRACAFLRRTTPKALQATRRDTEAPLTPTHAPMHSRLCASQPTMPTHPSRAYHLA